MSGRRGHYFKRSEGGGWRLALSFLLSVSMVTSMVPVSALAEAAGVPQPLVILALREQVNAYALPGAVVMTRGMTALITAPAERATLLAHEIGHLVLGHPELAMRRSRHSQYFLQRMRRAARRQDTQEAARLYVQAACSGEIGLAIEIAVLKPRLLGDLRLAELVIALDNQGGREAHLPLHKERHLDTCGGTLHVGVDFLKLARVLEGRDVTRHRHGIVRLARLRLAAAGDR